MACLSVLAILVVLTRMIHVDVARLLIRMKQQTKSRREQVFQTLIGEEKSFAKAGGVGHGSLNDKVGACRQSLFCMERSMK